MFDIGFSELMVIALVALIVIGPERLPRAARNLGRVIGRMQRYVADVKADVAREIELEELRKFKSEMEETARSFERNVHAEVRDAEEKIHKMAEEAKAETDSAASSSAPTPQLELGLRESSKPAQAGR